MTASDYAKTPGAYEIAEVLHKKAMKVKHPDKSSPEDGVNSFMNATGGEIRLLCLKHLAESPLDESVHASDTGILAEE
jgi:hypothetical protein